MPHRLEVDFVFHSWSELSERLHPCCRDLIEVIEERPVGTAELLRYLLRKSTTRGPDQVFFRLFGDLKEWMVLEAAEGQKDRSGKERDGFTEEALWALNLGLWESLFFQSENDTLEPQGLWAGVVFSDGVAADIMQEHYPLGLVVAGWADIHTSVQLKQVERLLQQAPDCRQLHRLLARYQERHSLFPEHALWLLENHPKEAHLYLNSFSRAVPEATRLYKQHLKKRPDPDLLYHAASFFSGHDVDQMKELCALGKALEPSNPRWPNHLAWHYAQAQEPESEITERLEAVEKSRGRKQASSLAEAAHRARVLQRTELAEELCRKFLALPASLHCDQGRPSQAYGRISNTAGLLALARGDQDKAEHFLRQAWKADFRDPGELGEELVKAGRKARVLTILHEFLSHPDVSEYEYELMSEWADELNQNVEP